MVENSRFFIYPSKALPRMTPLNQYGKALSLSKVILIMVCMEQERPQQEHEGEKYLKLLGLEKLADLQIQGRPEKMRDFLDICGEHARPLLVGLESLEPDDPRFIPTRDALRGYISKFVSSTES